MVLSYIVKQYIACLPLTINLLFIQLYKCIHPAYYNIIHIIVGVLGSVDLYVVVHIDLYAYECVHFYAYVYIHTSRYM